MVWGGIFRLKYVFEFVVYIHIPESDLYLDIRNLKNKRDFRICGCEFTIVLFKSIRNIVKDVTKVISSKFFY